MKQKFRMLTFVNFDRSKLTKNWDRIISETMTGIVMTSCSQLCGGSNVGDFIIYLIENDNVVNKVGWIPEEALLELEVQDRDKAEEMIELYNLKRENENES